tara:strand:- start:75 stop:827 length:753 start_codon:yes stop_codon:yes gene_type:complete
MSSDPRIPIRFVVPLTGAISHPTLTSLWFWRLIVFTPALNQILTAIPEALPPGTEAILKAIHRVRNLLTDLTTTAKNLLANTGAIQGQIIQLIERRMHLSGLLINQAIRLETPATATRQTRITSRHKVMLDTPAGAIHNTVDKAPENGITMTQQAGIEQGRQEIKGALFGIAGITLDQSFSLFKLEQLIKAPDHAMGTKCRRPGTPTKQPMTRGMHPNLMANPEVLAKSVSNTSSEQVANQNLSRRHHPA